MPTLAELLAASNAIDRPRRMNLRETTQDVLDALLMKATATPKVKRTVHYKGDIYEVACPNCDHAERYVFLTSKDVMSVKCPCCGHLETVAR